VNRAQKDAYKKDYAAAKADGKPFFPYAIYKDHIVGLLAIAIVVVLAISVRVTVGEPINPATTDFVPRPEWYFFFLFHLLKIFKNQNVFEPLIMATFIVPNILMALMFLLPFIDRGPERRPHKRPIAMMTASTVIFFLCYLTYLGATAPEGAAKVTLAGLDAQATAGLTQFETLKCQNCHALKGSGGAIGPALDNEANKKRGVEWQIAHLKDPKSKTPGSLMQAFPDLTTKQYQDLAYLLEGLGTKYK
jgi:menaquinol-cytochrome c reductase cytochrome b/c subunit